jgi:plastocyanin
MDPRTVARCAGLLVLACLAACGGGGSSNPNGNTPPGSTPPTTTLPPATSGATFTISSAGVVTPKEVTISVGQSVTVVNNHTSSHEIQSDPHPLHTDCPPTNLVGVLVPGQSRSSGAFPTARTCGFHDHGDSENANLQGRIVIR